jgi:hypothetical protein
LSTTATRRRGFALFLRSQSDYEHPPYARTLSADLRLAPGSDPRLRDDRKGTVSPIEAHKFALRVVAVFVSCLLAGCASTLRPKPGVYDVTEQRLKAGPRTLHVTYVTPVQPQPHRPDYFILFASGDGGWRGPSSAVLEHLAARGYSIVGIKAGEVIKPVRRAGERLGMTQAAQRLADIYVRARHGLGVAETAPMVMIGFSRGATLVALTAVTPELREGLRGAIAIALTREVDYLHAPEPAERRPGIQVDKRDRILIYPAVKSLSFAPLAVIQSMRDGYVPSAEARQLLGPDVPSRRLYEVPARNHRFGGGREAMLSDLDDALRWIEQTQNVGLAQLTDFPTPPWPAGTCERGPRSTVAFSHDARLHPRRFR